MKKTLFLNIENIFHSNTFKSINYTERFYQRWLVHYYKNVIELCHKMSNLTRCQNEAIILSVITRILFKNQPIVYSVSCM